MPLDEFLPQFDHNEVHSTRVAASPERTLAAARSLSSREVPLARGLMALRTLPARVRGERRRTDRPMIDSMLRGGFVVLAERPEELVLGVVGRFWQPRASILRIETAEFAAFDEPGWAKSAINFEVRPAPGGGTLLATETRIQTTDAASRRSFGRYWRLVGPWSALIRRAWLRAIRLRAERA
ncbi:MAG: hypothetical protein QOI32_15 [Thermoleophilaceae bacterium]|nr:hypothetical protein [Thermoleophilaceae bacterium]